MEVEQSKVNDMNKKQHIDNSRRNRQLYMLDFMKINPNLIYTQNKNQNKQ